jgi:hypothetical protein
VRVRVAVLRCAAARADCGGGLWWPESMMEMTCIHVWASHESAPSSDPINYISLFKKYIIVTGSVATMTQ